MFCKTNVKITNDLNKNLIVKLIDVDLVKNDVLGEKQICSSIQLEFVFDLMESGEFNPELQILITDESHNILYLSEINSEISGWKRDEVTGMFEKTTIEFKPIVIV